MDPLSREEIKNELENLDGWSFKDDSIRKQFSFSDFKEAMSFMVRVGFEAESLVHHPDWSNVYNRVSITLSTHDADDKVTGKDIQLAKAIEDIYKS